jgi:hypothetical protein
LPCHQRGRSFPLRDKPADRDVRLIALDAAPGEVEPDRLVAVAAPSQLLRAGDCEPPVVDVAVALERRERVGTRAFCDPGSFEALLELVPGTVSARERPGRQFDRVGLRAGRPLPPRGDRFFLVLGHRDRLERLDGRQQPRRDHLLG